MSNLKLNLKDVTVESQLEMLHLGMITLLQDRNKFEELFTSVGKILDIAKTEIDSLQADIIQLVDINKQLSNRIQVLEVSRNVQATSIVNIHNRVCEQVTALNLVMNYLETEQGWNRK